MPDDLLCKLFALCMATLVLNALWLGLMFGGRYNPLNVKKWVKSKDKHIER